MDDVQVESSESCRNGQAHFEIAGLLRRARSMLPTELAPQSFVRRAKYQLNERFVILSSGI